MNIEEIKQTKLYQDIKSEINEDLYRMCESYDDMDSWVDNVLDCPSDTLSDLLGQIPMDDEGNWNDGWSDVIDEIISTEVENVDFDIDDDLDYEDD